MTITRNKISVSEKLFIGSEINIAADKQSEYIRIEQGSDIINIKIDEIAYLIPTLKRIYKNREITDITIKGDE